MGSYITLIIDVDADDFVECLGMIEFAIITTYTYGDKCQIITQSDYMGYAEPLELYLKMLKKKIKVIDIHCIDVACAVSNHTGRHAKIRAWSCKKENKECR